MVKKNSISKSVILSIIVHMLILAALFLSTDIRKLVNFNEIFPTTEKSKEKVEVAFLQADKNPIKRYKRFRKKIKRNKIKRSKRTNSEETVPEIPRDQIEMKKTKVTKTIVANNDSYDEKPYEEDIIVPANKTESASVYEEGEYPEETEEPVDSENFNENRLNTKEIEGEEAESEELESEEVNDNLDKEENKEEAEETSENEKPSTDANALLAKLDNESVKTPSGPIDARGLQQRPGNLQPQYPLKNRMQKQQGTVVLKYLVTQDGLVDKLQIAKSSGYKSLDSEAVNKIRNWKFKPGQASETFHPIIFKLKGADQKAPSRLRLKKQS